MKWDIFSSFGLSFLGLITDKDQIVNYLCNGEHVVILNVMKAQHWVLAKTYDAGKFQVYDPRYQTTSYDDDDVTQAAVYEFKSKTRYS